MSGRVSLQSTSIIQNNKFEQERDYSSLVRNLLYKFLSKETSCIP